MNNTNFVICKEATVLKTILQKYL